MGELILWCVLIVVGLALLVKGADWFVDGSAGVAKKCNISPLIIGLTVVAFGTSAPELAVSIASSVQQDEGVAQLAIGNVVGSNISNILLILGVAALIHKLPVQRDSLRLDLPVLVFSSALLVGLGIWGWQLEWWDGLIFLAVFAVYMTVLIVKAKKGYKAKKALGVPEEEEPQKQPRTKVGRWFAEMEKRTWFLLVLTVVGLGMVVGGGTLLVEGAKFVARRFGASERIIGLTVVAIGTSLPELVTSIVAATKGETDIAVGNVIGSNLFNILLVAGVSCLIYPLPFSLEGNLIDALVALAAALLLYLFAMFDSHRLGRVAGVVMTACFLSYYVYLFLV